MKTTKPLLAVLMSVVANFAHAGTLTPVQPMPADYNEQFSVDDLLNGPSSMSEEECNKKPFAVYVKLSWMSKACIRYFPSDNTGVDKELTIYLNGDMNIDNGVSVENYRANYAKVGTYRTQVAIANRLSRITKTAFVIIARPGTLGSTGGNAQSNRDSIMRTENETLFVNAAIDAIKAKFGYDRINIEGQSGGGGIVGALLTEGRTDVDCAVSSSGSVSVTTQQYDAGSTLRASAYDPMRHIKSIKADPNRHFFQITDMNDTHVSPRSQKEFADGVAALGHNSVQIIADAAWDQKGHHALTDIGVRVMQMCRTGASNEEIQQMATKFSSDWVANQAKKAAKQQQAAAAQPTETAAQ